MKFSCTTSVLSGAISVAQRAVSAKSNIPSLEGIYMETMNGELKVIGYNLEVGIEVVIEAEIMEPGSIILNSRLFGEIIRRLPNDTVHITTDKENMTNIVCTMSEYNIVGMPSEEFPELPRVESEEAIEMPQDVLKSMIRQTIFAVSQNDNKIVHTGSLLEISKEYIRMVSVDGYRLAMREEKMDTLIPFDKKTFVVPGKTLSEVMKVLGDTDEPVSIIITSKHIVFSVDNIKLVSRLLDGDFLNYQNAIPKEHSMSLLTKVSPLIDSIERVSLIISDKMKTPIRCKFSPSTLEILCTTPIGRAHEQVDIALDEGELEIGLNNKYILDALKVCDEETVKIELNTPLTPLVIVPEVGNRFLFLVLPVRLRNDN